MIVCHIEYKLYLIKMAGILSIEELESIEYTARRIRDYTEYSSSNLSSDFTMCAVTRNFDRDLWVFRLYLLINTLGNFRVGALQNAAILLIFCGRRILRARLWRYKGTRRLWYRLYYGCIEAALIQHTEAEAYVISATTFVCRETQ